MRKSWKSIADALVVHMSRDEMQRAYDYQRELVSDSRTADSERDVAVDTMRFLAMCIAEYDEMFVEDADVSRARDQRARDLHARNLGDK